MSDEELIALCKQNDRLGQKATFDRYSSKMFNVCCRYLADVMEAEDAMTEGFVKAFSKISNFEYRGKGSFEGWIKRIVINECLMLLRKKKYEKVDIQNQINLQSETLTDSEIYHKEIMEHVLDLPKGYRTVFNMYVVEGYSHKEIGERLGISENTSKSQLSKARHSLMKTLKEGGVI